MKLLIADDELLTREGLISSVDWESLGIREILQADDGVNALQLAISQKPDIILSDVRMPRMTGIEMATQLEQLHPDTCIIFMSGYSDKEYLKAAIKLNAVNYIEKPLNPQEIREAVSAAVARQKQALRMRRTETLYSMETSSRLALLLTRPYQDNEESIRQLFEELNLHDGGQKHFITYIVKLRSSDMNSIFMNEFRVSFNSFLAPYKLRAFYIRMHDVYHVFHLMGTNSLDPSLLACVEDYLKEQLGSYGTFYIGRGDCVDDASKVYDSYQSAVITLQSSFFFAPGNIMVPPSLKQESPDPRTIKDFPSNPVARFNELILAGDEAGCRDFPDLLYRRYHENVSLLPNHAKDLYYKLFLTLNDHHHRLSSVPDNDFSEGSVIANLENCFTYDELHTLFTHKLDAYFGNLHTTVPEDTTIFMIKDYISKNFARDDLSIKEIGDHVFLSVSYICTYFKNQTGLTLNQYLTEYRMEKAKQLLADARYQITDISSKVGYSNGNYFGKSFKKFTGMSPSKYREKMLG